MKRKTRASAYLRIAMLIIALALPLLSLIVLGSLWLWQNGYVLYWALGACAITLAAYGAERWLLRDAVTDVPREIDDDKHPPADPAWSAREIDAWDAVNRVVEEIDPKTLTNRDAVLALGTRTIDAVAHKMHPDEKNPLWKFTVPEALALVERVSGQLGPFVRDNIPLGDRLTVGQVLAIYRWRSILGIAETAFDLWRIVRLLNPASAITQEMREQVTRQIYDWGREELGRRLATAYVREVGRAAIDLYSGRLRLSDETLAATVTKASRRDLEEIEAQDLAEPVRILIAGQTGAGKSSLVNALSEEVLASVDVLPATPGFTAYALEREGAPAAHVIDSKGLSDTDADLAALTKEAEQCDLILWVVSATRPDRETDRKALSALRDRMAARVDRRASPILMVFTHIDLLRPFKEWEPPYDLAEDERAKAKSIREAMQATAAETDTPIQSVVPVCLDVAHGFYNVDVLWARVIDVMPEAQSVRLARVLDVGRQTSWRRVWSQAVNGGRVITRALTS